MVAESVSKVRILMALACGVLSFLPGFVEGQEDERVPTIPNGVPAVVFPVQGTAPTAGGAWIGGTPSERETIDLLNAELEFAFGEEDGAKSWAFGPAVEARLARNPIIKVDPARLAYHGLLRKPERHRQIYEPLHSQLRQVAALFDARIVVLPLTVYYRGPNEEERAAADLAGEPALGRAVLLAAVIDVRASSVLWHGTIEGDAVEATSRAALTSLAFRVAGQLAPS